MLTHHHPPPPSLAAGTVTFSERPLSCGCAPQLWRQILLDAANGLHACMRCGAVSCTEALGDDGRGGGEPHTVYRSVALPEAVLPWLARWPRVAPSHDEPLWWMHASLHRSRSIYLPATLRCASAQALQAEQARLQALRHTLDQAPGRSLGLGATLRHCGAPADAPPQALPTRFAGYAEVWRDLQLTAQSDATLLIERADDMSTIAAELLAARTDWASLLEQTLSQAQPRATLAMLRAATQHPAGLTSKLTAWLIDILSTVAITPHATLAGRIARWHQVEVLLLIVAEHHCFSRAMSTTLRALMRRLARHDMALASQAGVVLRELGRHRPDAL